jgi:hypothetical protein
MKRQPGVEMHLIQPNAVYSLDAASAIGVSVCTLQDAVREGFLLVTKPGKQHLTTGESLHSWLRNPHTVKTA